MSKPYVLRTPPHSASALPYVANSTPKLSRYAQTIIADGPLGYWRLEEDDPGRDISGNRHHASAIDSESVFGKPPALRYDISNAAGPLRVDITDPEVHITKAPYSYEVWVRSTSSDFPFNNHYVLSVGINETYDTTIRLTATVRIGGWHRDGTGALKIVNSDGLDLTQWHHAVMVWDGAQNHLYIDGNLESSNSAVGSYGDGKPLDRLRIANGYSAHFGSTGIGTAPIEVDEVAIYDYPLTAAQIKHHYDVAMGIAV